jgi:hypothetical protein
LLEPRFLRRLALTQARRDQAVDHSVAEFGFGLSRLQGHFKILNGWAFSFSAPLRALPWHFCMAPGVHKLPATAGALASNPARRRPGLVATANQWPASRFFKVVMTYSIIA